MQNMLIYKNPLLWATKFVLLSCGGEWGEIIWQKRNLFDFLWCGEGGGRMLDADWLRDAHWIVINDYLDFECHQMILTKLFSWIFNQFGSSVALNGFWAHFLKLVKCKNLIYLSDCWPTTIQQQEIEVPVLF